MGDGPSEFQGVQRATRCRFTRIHEGKLGVAVCFHLTTLEKSKGYQVFPGRGTLAVCVAACDPKASTKSVAEATSAPPVRTTRQGVWDPPPQPFHSLPASSQPKRALPPPSTSLQGSQTQEQPQQGRADGPTSGIFKAKVCFCFVP